MILRKGLAAVVALEQVDVGHELGRR